MIEIVFNESAAGSLKIAQSYGKGKYRGGAISVFIKKKDGSEPTEEEKEAALHEAIGLQDEGLEIDADVRQWCEENGRFYSFLNTKSLLGQYKRSYFRELLYDWRI